MQRAKVFNKKKRNNKGDIPEKAVIYILSLQDEEIKSVRVKDVADAVKIDRAYLSRVFKSTLRISLTRFIKREKLYRAFFALEKEQDINVRDLSDRLGFPGIRSFEREFECFFLVKPGRYKELVKQRQKQPDVNLLDRYCFPL